MKRFLVLFAILILVLIIVACLGSGLLIPSKPANDNSAASQETKAYDAMQQAQQQVADADAAAVNETAQAQAANQELAIAEAATAQALEFMRAQLAMTADAAHFPSTQAAIIAQQTAQAIEAQSTAYAEAILMAQQQDLATATAQAMSDQQNAQAIEVQATVDARAMLLAQQQAEAAATAQAVYAQQNAQAGEVQATVDARAILLAQQQAEAAATAQAMKSKGIAASASQRQSEVMSWIIPIAAAIVFGLVLLLGAKFISGIIDAANQRRGLENHRLALLGTLFEAPTETFIFADDPLTGFATPQFLNPSDSNKDIDTSGFIESQDLMIDAEAPPAIVMLSFGDKILADRAEAREEAARCKLAMKLIRDAITHVGARSNHIPPAAQLGWPVGAWKIAVAILRPYGVEDLQGIDGGIYLVGQYPTLQALYIVIGEKRLSFFSPPAENDTND